MKWLLGKNENQNQNVQKQPKKEICFIICENLVNLVAMACKLGFKIEKLLHSTLNHKK